MILSRATSSEDLWPVPGTWGTVLFGYQNARKDWVIAPRFTQAGQFRDGLAPVKERGQWKVIDTAGTTVFVFDKRASIADMQSYRDGYSLVTIGVDGTTKLVDRSGKVAFESWALVREMSDGMAAASMGGGWCYINSAGRVVIDLELATAQPFRCGLAAVQDGDGEWRLIDSRGRSEATLRGVDYAESPICGRILARAAGTSAWGFLSEAGVTVIPFQFAEARAFSEGLAAVKRADSHQWGFIDPDGKFTIPALYDWAGPFDRGRASVIHKGERQMIDRGGAVLWRMSEIPIPARR